MKIGTPGGGYILGHPPEGGHGSSDDGLELEDEGGSVWKKEQRKRRSETGQGSEKRVSERTHTLATPRGRPPRAWQEPPR